MAIEIKFYPWYFIACQNKPIFLFQDFDASSNYLITGSMDHRVKMWHIGPGSGVDEKIAESHRVRHWSQLKTLEVHFPFCSTHDLHMNYVDCVRFIGDFIFSKVKIFLI